MIGGYQVLSIERGLERRDLPLYFFALLAEEMLETACRSSQRRPIGISFTRVHLQRREFLSTMFQI